VGPSAFSGFVGEPAEIGPSALDLSRPRWWQTGAMHEQDDRLHAVLSESQRVGFLGDRPIDEVIDHARAFVAALEGVTGRIVDLGSGGGVPGLVIAADRPDLSIVLVDRRAKRTDFLERVVRRCGWHDRIDVVHADVAHLIGTDAAGFDAVVARGFGPPAVTAEMGAALINATGRIVISEPPDGDRWTDVEARYALVRRQHHDRRVVVFERST